jgi:peptidoglycan hydrolase-like protein with peptidoglycan-binding domain
MQIRSLRTQTPKLVRITFGGSVAVLASLVGMGIQSGPAQAVVIRTPTVPVAVGRAIEAPSPYIPQSDCDLILRPGTVSLMKLLQRTYTDGSNLGILQSCAAEAMTGEHSDGRALDFALNVKNTRQHAEADAFLQWLFATDRYGNSQAMARRLGVMYVIYNAQIRSVGDSSYTSYDPSVCSNGRGDASTCHRNHIHISLSWAGALGKTSFWTGKVAAVDYGPCVMPGHLFSGHYTKPNPSPCPDAPIRPLPTLALKARGASVALVQKALKVTADGVFGPITANAVLTWRKTHHLSTTKPVVDSSMWAGLTSSGLLN